MAHAHDLGDGRHRQAVSVGRPDGFVALLAKVISGSLQRGFAVGVVLGEGHQTGSGFRGLTFGTGDLRIV